MGSILYYDDSSSKQVKKKDMEKEFIPYEQALALKELRFNEPCIACYTQNAYGSTPNQKVQYWYNPMDGNEDYVFVLAPLYQQVFRWFREEYNIVHEIVRKEKDNHSEFIAWIFTESAIEVVPYSAAVSYEEAELECLKKLIEIIKNK